MTVISKKRIESCKKFMVQIYDIAYDPSNPVQGTFTSEQLRSLKGTVQNYALYGTILNEHSMMIKKDKLWHVKFRKEDLHLFDSIIEKWLIQKDEKYELNRLLKKEQLMKLEQEEAERKAKEEIEEANHIADLLAEDAEKRRLLGEEGNISIPDPILKHAEPVIAPDFVPVKKIEFKEFSLFWGMIKYKRNKEY